MLVRSSLLEEILTRFISDWTVTVLAEVPPIVDASL